MIIEGTVTNKNKGPPAGSDEQWVTFVLIFHNNLRIQNIKFYDLFLVTSMLSVNISLRMKIDRVYSAIYKHNPIYAGLNQAHKKKTNQPKFLQISIIKTQFTQNALF